MKNFVILILLVMCLRLLPTSVRIWIRTMRMIRLRKLCVRLLGLLRRLWRGGCMRSSFRGLRFRFCLLCWVIVELRPGNWKICMKNPTSLRILLSSSRSHFQLLHWLKLGHPIYLKLSSTTSTKLFQMSSNYA